jgi:hypothetical protein
MNGGPTTRSRAFAEIGVGRDNWGDPNTCPAKLHSFPHGPPWGPIPAGAAGGDDRSIGSASTHFPLLTRFNETIYLGGSGGK